MDVFGWFFAFEMQGTIKLCPGYWPKHLSLKWSDFEEKLHEKR